MHGKPLGRAESVTELLGFEEVGDIIIDRVPHQLLGRIGLFESALVHDGDPVRKRDTVRQVVRHV